MNLRSGFLLLLFLIFAGLTTACKKRVSVLVITGGHAFDTTDFFAAFSTLEGVHFDSVSKPEAMNLLASDRVLDYDVLAFYDFVPDMKPADSTVFLTLASRGQSILFLHHSLCNFQSWDGYMQMIGGRYCSPEFFADSLLWSNYKHDIELKVQIADSHHPVTRGIEAFTIRDEGYSNIAYMPGITPLLKTEHPDCSSIVGWVNSYDRSNIVYLMLGHDKQAYSNEAFKILLTNSIHWLSAKPTI